MLNYPTGLNNEFQEIKNSDLKQSQKNKKYSRLMTIMERKFNIPIMEDKEFEEKNIEIMKLYKKISLERKSIPFFI